MVRKEKNYTSLALHYHGLIQIFYTTHLVGPFLVVHFLCKLLWS